MEGNCIRYYNFGNPKDVLKMEKRGINPLLEEEILVRMITAPINPSDLIPITGAYSHRIDLPHIPGYEGVGIVVDVGRSVPKSLIGKRVLPLRGEGTWQEYVKTSAKYAIQIPATIDDDLAAQLYINPVTAWLTCTETLKLKPDDTLLVNACGSAIGHIFVQLSNILGFRLIAITRNDDYTKELLKLGASHVINTSVTPLYNTVMELTKGVGATAAIDSVGGKDGSELAFCVRPNGVFLTIGLLSGIPINWSDISKRTNIEVKLFHLRYWNAKVSVQTWQDTFNHIITLLKGDHLQLKYSRAKYKLEDVNKAVQIAESPSHHKGKILLTY